MPGSTLIFLLVIAIWAAVLAQSWARHHQYVATARTVDKFSTALRVLERRAPLPRLEPMLPVAPPEARPAPLEDTVPEPYRSADTSAPRVAPAAGDPGEFPASVGTLPATKVRAVFFLVALATLVVTSVLAMLSVVPWGVPALALAAVMAVLTWGVLAARQAAARRRAAAPRRRPARPAAARPHRVPAPRVVEEHDLSDETDREQLEAERVAQQRAAEEAAREEARRQAECARRAEREFFDQKMFEPAERPAPPQAPVVEAQAVLAEVQDPALEVAEVVSPEESAWEPVPVPRPTYTMKDTVARRPERIEDIPFDGRAMALDVEDEELPAVWKAV